MKIYIGRNLIKIDCTKKNFLRIFHAETYNLIFLSCGKKILAQGKNIPPSLSLSIKVKWSVTQD
jgi:hypothetical protein